jgi:hypothetical protein
MSNYFYFTPQKLYEYGHRVLHYSLDKADICTWECVSDTYQSSEFKPYTYSLQRKRITHWRLVCCEPASTHQDYVYYGECAKGFNRSKLIQTHTPELFSEIFYDNETFI